MYRLDTSQNVRPRMTGSANSTRERACRIRAAYPDARVDPAVARGRRPARAAWSTTRWPGAPRLTALRAGRVRREDACDAQTYLRRAARYHGEPTQRGLPGLPPSSTLTLVTYAFGDCFPAAATAGPGPARSCRDLAHALPEFSVFVVEVCLGCGWNYLVTSYVLGHAASRSPPPADRSTTGSRGVKPAALSSRPAPSRCSWGCVGAMVLCRRVWPGVAYARTTIPSPSAHRRRADDDDLLQRRHDGAGADRRRPTAPTCRCRQVPMSVQHAVLAAEDRHFYSEPGVSPTGIVRALLVDLKGGDISQGGSTITQQYVEERLPEPAPDADPQAQGDPHRDQARRRPDRRTTILDDYLNTIYFGRGAYGIQAAAKAYFDERRLAADLAQGALLAAVIRGPSLYDPRTRRRPRRTPKRAGTTSSTAWSARAGSPRRRPRGCSFPNDAELASRRRRRSARARPASSATRSSTSCAPRTGSARAQLDLGGYKIVTTINAAAEKGLIDGRAGRSLPKNQHGHAGERRRLGRAR